MSKVKLDYRPIPRLEDYGVDEHTGFLPSRQPLRRLPPAFEPWECLLDNLSSLLMAGKLRDKINRLEELNTDGLCGLEQYQRAFLVLSLLSHAFVWGSRGEPVKQLLPRQLAKPWLLVSKWLGLRPISCQAALVYYNWRLIDTHSDRSCYGADMSLSNLATLHTISGGFDESWFYLITIAIEAAGGRHIRDMVSVLHHVEEYRNTVFSSSFGISTTINDKRKGDVLTVSDESVAESALITTLQLLTADLKSIGAGIVEMSEILMQMSRNCDPYIFYHRVRIYFSGWTNFDGYRVERYVDRGAALSDDGDDEFIDFDNQNGLVYEGDEDEIGVMFREEGYSDYYDGKYKLYPGGSAAQSCLIHALDVFLGVEHHVTGQGPHSSDTNLQFQSSSVTRNSNGVEKRVNFLEQMRYHMPASFRRFLVHLEQTISLSEFINEMRKDISKFRVVSGNSFLWEAKNSAVAAYDSCVRAMVEFRSKHIQIVTRYIVMQAERARQTESSCNARSGSKQRQSDDISERGTGGTEVMPFLKQSRDETASLLPSSDILDKRF